MILFDRAMGNTLGSYAAANASPVHRRTDCEAKERHGVLGGSGKTLMSLINYLFFILFYLISLTLMTHAGHRTIYLKEIRPPHQRIRKLHLDDLKK